LPYEEEVLRDPYQLRHWWRYLQERRDKPGPRRWAVYERALRALPGSYKLWKAYIGERRAALDDVCPTLAPWEALNRTYERALVTLHPMPRIWLDYLALLGEQRLLTRSRRVFDRALASTPVTQHARLWPVFLELVAQPWVPDATGVRAYARYLKLEPEHAEECLAYLLSRGHWGPAARLLARLVDDQSFVSLRGKTRHGLWLELCELLVKHPAECEGAVDVDAVVRSGIRRYKDEVGRLWTSLADHHIERGAFDRARDVYEEGLASVSTVRDFSLIYDALVQFEESLVAARMERLEEDPEVADGAEARDAADDPEALAALADRFVLDDPGDDVDLRLARLERLMERRPELLSSVVLRQNPHAVAEWHKRARLFGSNPAKQILCYTEAVRTVDVDRAVGKPHTLWCAFAKLYERHGDLANARAVFGKAVEADCSRYADDLAAVWCEWIEMELRHDEFTRALSILRRATTEPPGWREHERQRKANPSTPPAPARLRVHRSVRLWNLLVDLEESLGTPESTKAIYYRMIDSRIATPQTVLNFAAYLVERGYHEESFRVYERGVGAFRFPHSKDIWMAYLVKFGERYGGEKLERARDLFEGCLRECPARDARPIWLMFAELEEKHGSGRRAMDVYERAFRALPRVDKGAVVERWVGRASELFGIAKVREVFETAIEAEGDAALTDADCRDVCRRFARVETNLGEIDRARGIWVHGASLADPTRAKDYWDEFTSFEVTHGNEDTFREMLRVKRSVQASHSSLHFNTNTIEDMAFNLASGSGPAAGGAALPGFRSGGVTGGAAPAGQAGSGAVPAPGPDDIDIDADG